MKKSVHNGLKTFLKFFFKKFVKLGIFFNFLGKKIATMLQKGVAQWGKNFSEVFFCPKICKNREKFWKNFERKCAQWGKKFSEGFFFKKHVKMGIFFFNFFGKKIATMLRKGVAQWGKKISEVFTAQKFVKTGKFLKIFEKKYAQWDIFLTFRKKKLQQCCKKGLHSGVKNFLKFFSAKKFGKTFCQN